MTARLIALLPAMTAAGLLFGRGYFAALRRAAVLNSAECGLLRPIGLAALRFIAAAVFLLFAARLGALPLLAVFAGFLMARSLALRVNARAD